MICSVMVVLPEDSGPKISTTRPRGTPPTPNAASKEIEPVLMVEIGTIASLLPRRMIEPLPNCFSICESARSIARERSSAMPETLHPAGRSRPVYLIDLPAIPESSRRIEGEQVPKVWPRMGVALVNSANPSGSTPPVPSPQTQAHDALNGYRCSQAAHPMRIHDSPSSGPIPLRHLPRCAQSLVYEPPAPHRFPPKRLPARSRNHSRN